VMLLGSLCSAHEVGDHLVTIADDTSIKNGDTVIAALKPGNQVVFRGQRDDLFLVEWEYETGWVKQEDVMGLDQAFDHFTKLLMKENEPVYLIGRGAIHQRKRDFENAIRDYNTAIENGAASNAWVFNRRGMCWRSLGNSENAISDYDEAIRIDPAFVTAIDNRGLVRMFSGDYQGAVDDFAKSLKLNPKNHKALANRAWLFAGCPDAKFRNAKKAIEEAKKACLLTNDRSDSALASLAAGYAEAGEFEKAVEVIDKAIAIAPGVWDSWHRRFQAREPYRLKVTNTAKD